ncbi:hypothetical protein TNIN_295171 [Trichonephila inaurata madagascariensis]|uniref:Uncharacterized protein n=1 Tax=Trichonephila inaurata madagascariensis TaxID=2747483 RepID=A0A8X6YXM0_9ARAC|nr:hypothetical protein TNIN_295171 [Trichonephila inaurata madagascariensis]
MASLLNFTHSQVYGLVIFCDWKGKDLVQQCIRAPRHIQTPLNRSVDIIGPMIVFLTNPLNKAFGTQSRDYDPD